MENRFHLGLTTFLAFALGVSTTGIFQSRFATAQPTGPNVSYGSNPVVNYGGTIYDYGNLLLLTAPSDQDIVLTDIHLTAAESSSDCRGVAHVTFVTNTSVHAEFHIGLNRYGYDSSQYDGTLSAKFNSGIRIAAGSPLTVDVARIWDNGCGNGIDLAYVVTGYAASP